MAQRKLSEIPADDLWAQWRDDVERLVKDSYELFSIRRQFREIATLFEQNEHLQRAGANLWLWLVGCYAATVLMRFRREVDGQPNTVNLRTLLEQIEKRPDVITRGRIAHRRGDNGSELSLLLSAMIDERFTSDWAHASATGSPDDQIDSARVRADRLTFETATADLDEITSRTIAHRSRERPSKTAVAGVDAIFELFGQLLTKYLALLTGADLVNVEPTPQYDTLEPFTFPWHPTAYREWTELRKQDVQEEAK